MVSVSKCNLPHPKQPRRCDEVHQVILPHPRRTEVGRVSVTGALLVTDHIYVIVAGWYGQRHVPFLEIVSYHTCGFIFFTLPLPTASRWVLNIVVVFTVLVI